MKDWPSDRLMRWERFPTTRNDGVYKIPCFLLFAVRLDQQTEKQRGQGGIWIIIFTFECMFDISLFIQGEYMA